MMERKIPIVIITMNVNGMNCPIKRKQIAEWIKNYHPTICCFQEIHVKQRDTHRIKVKGWSRICYASAEVKKKKQEKQSWSQIKQKQK